MAADLIIEWIQRNLVLVTFRAMLLMDAVTVAILVKMVMIMMMMVVSVVMVMVLLSLETRRTTLFCTGSSQMGRATGLDDTGKVMTVGELLLMMILQVRREFVGAAFR